MPSPVTVEDLARFHRLLGIDRAVIVQASPQGSDNTCLVDTLRVLPTHGLQARGVAVVADNVTETELHMLHEAGVRGVRLNLQTFGISTPQLAIERLHATARPARLMGWHVQLYAGLQVVQSVAETIAELGVPVVIDHYGLARASLGTAQPGFSTLLDLVRNGPVHVKLSAPYRIADPAMGENGHDIARALIECRIERMLWGTDWPHTHPRPGQPRPRHTPEPLEPVDDGAQLNLFTRWTSAAERQQIMVDNPARLYGFAPLKQRTPALTL